MSSLMSDEEQEFVEMLMVRQGSQLMLAEWVDQKKRKVRKKRTRLCVIGSYSFALIKRDGKKSDGKKKFRVSSEGHFLDLSRLSCIKPSQLELTFANPKHNNREPYLFELHSNNAADIAAAIRQAISQFTVGFPEAILPRIDISKENMQNVPLVEDGPACGFMDTYKAFCSYFGTVASPEIEQYVSDLSAAGSVDFNFNDCPGVDAECNIPLNIIAIASAFRYNQYFRSIRCNGVNRKGLVSHMILPLRCNTHVTRFDMVSMPPVDLSDLAEALKTNPSNSLTMINLNNTHISKGITDFCSVVQDLTHSLKVLNLASTCKKAESMSNLFIALRNNYGMSITISELDVSGNRFDDVASNAFETWLSRVSEYSALTVLRLSDTALNFTAVMAYVHYLTKLRELDVSKNKLETRAVQQLVNAIEKSTVLQTLNVSLCHLPNSHAAGLILAMVRNKLLKNTKIDVSGNDFVESDAEAIADSMTYSVNCHTLNLANNKFKERGLIGLLQSLVLAENRTLNTLILDNTFKNTYKGDKVASALVSTVSCIASLQKLQISGGLGPVALPLFSQLKGNKTLVELDVSNNDLGDVGASAIADLLRHNSTLQSLKCDGNGIGPTGWKMVLSSFIHNTSLLLLEFPWNDYQRMISKGSATLISKSRLNEVRSVLLDIQAALQHNQRGKNLSRFHQSSEIAIAVPETVEPLAAVPSKLRNHARSEFRRGSEPEALDQSQISTLRQSGGGHQQQVGLQQFRRRPGQSSAAPSRRTYDDVTGDRTMAGQFTDYTESTFNTYTDSDEETGGGGGDRGGWRGTHRTQVADSSDEDDFDVL